MAVITKSFSVKTRGDTDIIDITGQVNACLKESKLNNGTLTVFIPVPLPESPPLNMNRDYLKTYRLFSRNWFPNPVTTITTSPGVTGMVILT